MASVFYSDLFTAQPELNPDEVLAHVPPRVTVEMKELLKEKIHITFIRESPLFLPELQN